MPVLYDDWERKPPRLYDPREPRTVPTYVTYSSIEIVEGSDIDVNLREFVGGAPTVESSPEFVEQDGTVLLGDMPEGEEEFFGIEIRSDA